MAVPTYDKFIEPILRYLAANPSGARAKDVYEAAARTLGLSDEQRQEWVPSGAKPVYINRASWAHDRLKRAGLSSSPRHGFWKLTDRGFEFSEGHSSPLSPDEVEKLAVGYIDVRLRPSLGAAAAHAPIEPPVAQKLGATASPDDRLEDALAEIRKTAAAELLEILKHVSPTYFESVVLDVLHKMGYGATRSDLQRVGGAGDGGIDGIISLDRLGLERVYVQAKRWQQTVGRPEIQAFYGALAGQRATKGVFITTSVYTPQAVEFAKSIERIVLVDGPRLAELMIEYEVGVSSRVIKVPKIDSDYFDEEAV
jgi:restriction system protein